MRKGRVEGLAVGPDGTVVFSTEANAFSIALVAVSLRSAALQ